MRHRRRCTSTGAARRSTLRSRCRCSMPSPIAGPTTRASTSTERIALGARRLSDHRPRTAATSRSRNEDGTIVAVVFNGEIYNFRDLRERPRARGHVFRTDVRHRGARPPLRGARASDLRRRSCDGMFAFAIWDERRQKLLLVRDRLGIKPLYVAHDGERLVFGSEIKALLAPPRRQRAARSRRDRRASSCSSYAPGAAHHVRRDRGAAARAPARVRRTRRPDAAAGGTCRSSAPPSTGTSATRPTSSALTCARRCAATSSATCRSAPSSAAASTAARSSR